MRRSSLIAFVVLALILIIAIGVLSWVVGTRNALVGLDENVKTQWAQVENVLQRRFDLMVVVYAHPTSSRVLGEHLVAHAP